MTRRLAHAVLVAVGLLVLLYPVTVGADPRISCRGVEMSPGDSCAKADGSSTQTYEERRRTAAEARPLVGAVGLAITAFGAVLLVSEIRRQRSPVNR